MLLQINLTCNWKFLPQKVSFRIRLRRISQKNIVKITDHCLHSLMLKNVFVLVQTLMAANDGLIDGPGSHTAEAQLIGSCFHLLLEALLALFSWYCTLPRLIFISRILSHACCRLSCEYLRLGRA